MEKPWWLYGSIALGCVFLFLVIKVVEKKFMKGEENWELLYLFVGLFGSLAAVQAAIKLKFFD